MQILKCFVPFIKDVVSIFLLFYLMLSCSAQKETAKSEFQVIKLNQYKGVKGTLIPARYESSIYKFIEVPASDDKRIDLTIEQINRAEKILKDGVQDKIRQIMTNGNMYFSPEINTKKDTMLIIEKSIKLAEKQIKNYYRQYLGYLNDKDETIVRIFLFDYSKRKEFPEIEDWRKAILWGIHGFYEENTRVFTINLTKGKIE